MAEYFDMGKYAFFVWGSYGMVALCLVVEVLMLRRRRRTILQQLSRMIRIKERESA